MGWKELTDDVAKRVRNAFPTAATYTPASGSPYSITGVFNHAHTEIQILDGAEVQSVFPTFFVRRADMQAAPAPGARVTIESVQYEVDEARPDGEAGTLLVLTKI